MSRDGALSPAAMLIVNCASPGSTARRQSDQAQEACCGRKHGVAGCTAGLTSVLALQPLDVVKTRLLGPHIHIHAVRTCGSELSLKRASALAVQDGLHGVLPLYQGTRDALRTIVREEGWQALYAGLSPALLGAGVPGRESRRFQAR